MKKIINITLVALMLFTATSCKDFLDTASPSVLDRESVFSSEESARAALYYGYETLRANRSLHSTGFFWHPVWGSDIEDSQDTYNEGSAGILQKWFYPLGTSTYNINTGEGTEVFTKLYETISVANSLISSFESLSNFGTIMSGEPNSLSDIYGQAVALRATCYWELCRWYGDIPHVLNAGEKAQGLTSRYAIYDYHVSKLIEVEPHMFRPGEGINRADVMNRTYVQGLIGRICLYNGGYATRRTDLGADFYTDAKGNVLSFEDWSVEKNQAIYGRRSDWKEIFAIAKQYLKMCADNPGSVVLHTTDPRGEGANGEVYNNPFQYTFHQMHAGDNVTLADESIYEIPYEALGGSDRPAYIGRPSTGGNGQAPCIACGQDRIQAHFYYGWFDNEDMRRDASVAVTGSTGQGEELIQSFDRSAWGKGSGPGTNKWDWNRIATPNTQSYGNSGINTSYMRISHVYLMLAEVYAALGEDANAKTYLGMVHHRAFPGNKDANFDQYIADCGSIYKAVIKERALEFSGEGMRRFDIIRTGILPEVAVENRKVMKTIIDGIRANGYYTFDNGNQFPAYIWTKMVDAKAEYGYRLTAQTPADKEDDPVLFPGWRGQHNNWGGIIPAYANQNMTNVAIKGLFKHIAPGSAEALALEADGYVQTNWGIDMLNYEDSYANKLFAGYSDADFAAKNPPIHLLPNTYQVLLNSGITNGYGFRQQ
ncbi:RagB/SusD family nutrient uptake outer membrane protein [Bacteroides sp. 214]|uniref:RagB/SusD family nutrient uptake outer membrane protein n=1 Tax=Bacteroides sp. 214 TaxID=2302935 RepID=UPI0013D4DE6D|nr:RagB/SusD family nutrient uptake outer membrane protein [Bacteroides sp. 214]NDW12148.1 RagB/SusD family nutrient uptake outer membrane protein [Bacteroides sp. 214]